MNGGRHHLSAAVSRFPDLGVTRGKVHLAPSNPAWAEAFEVVADEVRAALGAMAVAVEHVGSTAVPGLPAKPILDIAAGLRPGADPVEALESLGFIQRGNVKDEQLFGWEDSPRHRVVNLHVVLHGSRRWREWLLFRDELRVDDALRDEYATLKADLARRFPDDRHAYIAGKKVFVRRVLGG